MTKYYNIKSELNIESIDKIHGLSLEFYDDKLWIKDKYNNVILVKNYKNKIRMLICYGKNDPRFILYQLSTIGNSLFITEESISKYKRLVSYDGVNDDPVYEVDHIFYVADTFQFTRKMEIDSVLKSLDERKFTKQLSYYGGCKDIDYDKLPF